MFELASNPPRTTVSPLYIERVELPRIVLNTGMRMAFSVIVPKEPELRPPPVGSKTELLLPPRTHEAAVHQTVNGRDLRTHSNERSLGIDELDDIALVIEPRLERGL